ncbi:MAG: molybdopterin molybdotransferase MoeA [Gemmataceae bacterium]|nr:molybdopterin molybdotransferase MoeA [Gemmataceae bacterium]
MLEVADALAEVLARCRPRRPRRIGLGPIHRGLVLAADVIADLDSPPFDKSLRDGYAVRSAETGDRRVVEEIAAGSVPTKVIGEGEAARIFTGAPIPDGADAVVMQEDAEVLADGRVRFNASIRPGQWVFTRGKEMRAGEVVVAAGTVITPAVTGMLAAVGAVEVPTWAAPAVEVQVTGDELVDGPAPAGLGQIRNSNGPMLAALVQSTGFSGFSNPVVPDRADALRNKLGKAVAGSDVLIVAGGVSVGDYDLVPQVLAELGVEVHFRQVRMKPGKPLLFGTKGDTLVFGLPGNPVSAFVCFELFVRPALRKLAGHADPGPRTVRLPLAAAVAETNDRPTYRPAKLEVAEVGWEVRPLPWGGAPDLRSLLTADALVVLPAGDARYDRGTPVPVILLGTP